jgi:hypothetical protein
VGKVRYCTRNMDPAREETGFDAHPPHLLPLCQGASTGTQEVDMETKTDTPTTPTTAKVARTPFGKKLLEIRQRIMASGRPLLDWDDIDREMVAQRRGEWQSEEQH